MAEYPALCRNILCVFLLMAGTVTAQTLAIIDTLSLRILAALHTSEPHDCPSS